MEEDLNFLNFFVVKQQKREDFFCKKKTFGCMLFNNFNTFKSFKCFKGAMHPRHTCVFRFKHDSLWDET